jgi:cytochrome P450
VRRRRPSADVISQLLQQGFNDLEILTEALTYGAAGMATTREFVTLAAWHLLDEPDLRAPLPGCGASPRSSPTGSNVRQSCMRFSGWNPWSVSSDAPPGSRSPCTRILDR